MGRAYDDKAIDATPTPGIFPKSAEQKEKKGVARIALVQRVRKSMKTKGRFGQVL
jgi:hypothetical protein